MEHRMTLKKALIAVLMVLSGPVFASDCSQEGSMPAMRRCLIETTTAEMEKAYNMLLPKLASDQARKALEASQEAFIEYRYQSCTAVWEASQQFGWVAEDYATNCVTGLTKERQKFLLGILDEG
jgi:uncharacterized protein YecT (DUF1311 family)